MGSAGGEGSRDSSPFCFSNPGSNRGQITRFKLVSQVGAIDLERVANLAGANRSGIDPVDEGVAVDVDV